MTFVFIVLFGFLFGSFGGAAEGEEGFVVGALFGALTGLYLALRMKFNELERRLKDNEIAVGMLSSTTVQPELEASDASALDEIAGTDEPDTPQVRQTFAAQEAVSSESVVPEPPSPDRGAVGDVDPWLVSERETPRDLTPTFFEQAAGKVKDFFTTGNVVVKIGMVVLFFGVSFLIKYAQERGMLPIEFRLGAIAAIGVGLLIVGWKLRQRRPGYAMALQGGAIGILYLTVFGAARLYQVLPMGLAFGLMLAFVILSGALAVLQNAPALAAFGSAGGFLAPVLTSTGGGSHVALFSYYALLNLGILGIAWFKAWRGLNWLGFVFTFVIATAWGARYYTAEHFSTTEPFLILFVLFYIGISILFATRQPPRLRGLVDGSLVFGVPIVGFALQSRLVRGTDFALAYSALALGALYVVLAYLLWRRYRDDMRLLTESFLALGVIFLSLAIPLTLDGYWTAAAWSLEGAGIVWVGLRQRQVLARSFGILLQLGGAFLFVSHGDMQTTTPLMFNSAYLGSVMIALAGLCSAYLYSRHREALTTVESALDVMLLGWGLWWWFASGGHEIFEHAKRADIVAWAIMFTALSALALSAVAARLNWKGASFPAIGLLPVLGGFAVGDLLINPSLAPYRVPYGYAWVLAIVAHYAVLRWYAQNWREKLVKFWHAGSVWLITLLATWAYVTWIDISTRLSDAWVVASAGLVPASIVIALTQWGHRMAWPIAAFPNSYRHQGLALVVAYLVAWSLLSVTHAGDPLPLAFIPVLNPVELIGLLVLLSVSLWWWVARHELALSASARRYAMIGFGILCFIWFNAVLFRAIHHTTGTPYELSVMWRSPTLQSTISLAWTVLGSVLMALAALKLKLRDVWIAGAAILGLVVLKLFTVDLADIGTVARIVSFMGVGLLLLLIGYFAPLPPQRDVEQNL